MVPNVTAKVFGIAARVSKEMSRAHGGQTWLATAHRIADKVVVRELICALLISAGQLCITQADNNVIPSNERRRQQSTLPAHVGQQFGQSYGMRVD